MSQCSVELLEVYITMEFNIVRDEFSSDAEFLQVIVDVSTVSLFVVMNGRYLTFFLLHSS